MQTRWGRPAKGGDRARRLVPLVTAATAAAVRGPTGRRILTLGGTSIDSPGATLDPAPPRPGSPLVSIIVPAYQGERYIEEALRSALDGTVRDIEVIVVDDGSTDATAAIAERLAAEDDRVRFVRQAHRGASAARNTALAIARGRWAALLDEDDVWLPRRLERQLAFLAGNPDVAVLGSYGWHIGPTGRRTGVFAAGPRSREELIALRARNEVIFLLAPSAIMDLEVIRALGGFREDYRSANDVELWTRVADAHVVLALPELLVCYRVHEDATSIRRFFEQQELLLLIARNAGLRRAGRPEVDVAELRRELHAEPLVRRVARQRDVRCRYWYRQAGTRLAAGDPRGVIWLAAATAIAPEIVLGRLRRQVVPFVRTIGAPAA